MTESREEAIPRRALWTKLKRFGLILQAVRNTGRDERFGLGLYKDAPVCRVEN